MRAPAAGFVEPCLPSPTAKPPAGDGWIHEIKHDGYRLMARRDGAGIRLITRNGHDWSKRFPAIVATVNALKVRLCLIDGEAVACDGAGLAVFQMLRRRRDDDSVSLYAFDLLELNGCDLRREPIEMRKAALTRLLRAARSGIVANARFDAPGEIVYRKAAALGCEGIVSKRLGSRYVSGAHQGVGQDQESGGAGRAPRSDRGMVMNMSSVGRGLPLPDVNSGKDWSEMDLEDLKNASAQDCSLEETAAFLCRNRAEVKAKAKELGLALPQRAKQWAQKSRPTQFHP
jgi:hypothetical protein